MTIAKVLVIEDEAFITKEIVESLERLGYEISAAFDSGEEALKAIAGLKPDIAIIDVTLKGKLDGIETAAKINEVIDIPVVYMTAHEDPEIIERLTKSHPYGFLFKPLNERDLNTCLTMALYRFETEKKLKDSEERYFRLTENARDMIFRMSLPEGTYEYVNRAAFDLTGYTPEEFYISPLLFGKIMHPDWKHYFEVQFQKLIEGEADPFYEFRIIHKSGQAKWLNQRNVLIKDSNGKPVALEGIVTDITLQKKTEDVIRMQSEEYRSIFDAIPAMVLLKDTKNCVIRANKLSASYFGIKVEELEGKYLDEFFPDAADSYLNQDTAVISSGEPMLGILEKHESPQKGSVWLKFDKYPFRNHKGGIIGIIVMAQDVTREKEIEKQLREIEAQSTALINTIPDLLFQYDSNGVHLNYKVKDEKDLFLRPELFMGKKVTEVLPGEIGGKFLYYIKEAFETKEIQIYEYELRVDNEIRDYEVRFVKSGEDQVLGIVRDVTDRKKTEKALTESEEKYKNLVHNAPIALTRFIPHKKIFEFSNEELEKQAGVTLEELNAMTDEEFNSQIYHEDRENVLREYDNWRDEKFAGIKKLVYRIVNKRGQLLWLDSYHYADFDKNGRVEAINQIYIDISERKKTEDALSRSEEQYRNLARNAPVAVTRLVVKDRKYDFVNDEFTRQCGYTMDEINLMNDRELAEMIYAEDRKRVVEEFNRWKENGCDGVKFMEYRICDRKRNILWLNTFIYGEFNTSGELETINQICIDVTNRKEAGEALKQSEEKFRAVSESMRAQIVIFQEEKFVYVNPYSEQLTGYSEEELLKKKFWGLVHPDDREFVKQRGLARQRSENVPHEYEMRIITKSGAVKWLYYSAVIIEYLGKPAVLGTAFDISDRKKYEEALRTSEERYRAFIDQNFEGIFRIEMLSPVSTELPVEEQVKIMAKYSYVAECNEAFSLMMGYENTNSIIGKRIEDLNAKSSWNYLKSMERFILNGYRSFNDETRESLQGSEEKYFLNNAVGIIEDGMLQRIWGTRQDITEKRNADNLLKKSLHEKDILLKEIHHRVKNNLQIVSSLLKLQSQYITDKKVLDLFTESRNRVHSMSIIHQKLYQTRDLSSINFGDYIGMLISHLFQSFGLDLDKFKIKINAGDLVLSLDNAIPAGLIINELVTNALKHGFNGNKSGGLIEITVTFNEKGSSYKIIVKDDGSGMPENFDIYKSPSFGLKLVSMLTNQMNGKINYFAGNGTEFVVELKSAEYKQRS